MADVPSLAFILRSFVVLHGLGWRIPVTHMTKIITYCQITCTVPVWIRGWNFKLNYDLVWDSTLFLLHEVVFKGNKNGVECTDFWQWKQRTTWWSCRHSIMKFQVHSQFQHILLTELSSCLFASSAGQSRVDNILVSSPPPFIADNIYTPFTQVDLWTHFK